MTARGRAQIIVGGVGAFLIISGVYHLMSSQDTPRTPVVAPSSSPTMS